MRLYVDPKFASPYAMSVFVALHEKRLPFAIETVDLAAGAHQQPAYARISITQRVPTLVDGDFALMLNRLLLNGDTLPDRLARYARLQWQRASVQAWLGKERPPLGVAP